MKIYKKEYLNQIFKLLSDFTENTKLGKNKVVNFIPPDLIISKFDFEIHKKLSDNELIETAKKVLDYSIHTGHPHYYNTLLGGTNEYALSGEYISNALNNAMYTYEAAPVFSMMEDVFYNYIGKDILSWDNVEGIFAPGGSISNLYGLLVARHYHNPDFKKKGLYGSKPLAIFTSELSHYSIKKSAIICGYGTDHIYQVEADLKGKLILSDLEKKIVEAKNNGAIPAFCNATVGTTVFGAIDPVEEIGTICKKHNIWLHVDGCFGGSMLFVDEQRKKIGEMRNVDSFCMDFHKVLNVPLCCAIFITKHVGILDSSNSTNAEYLFMKDKLAYDANLDSGDKSIQCGRHNDVIKLWMYWRSFGTEGIKELIKNAMNNAKYLAESVKKHDNFKLILEPEFTSVSFYYLPERLKNMKMHDENYLRELNKIAPKIKSEMVKSGNMMVAYQKQTQEKLKYVNFLRPIIHVDKDKEDCDFIVNEIHYIGKNL